MEPERAPQRGSRCAGGATHGDPDARASRVVKLYAHLQPQSLHTLGSLVRALDTDDSAWMDGDGQALASSSTASVLIVAPDNVHRCVRLVAQQAQGGGRLRLSVAGHWAGMVSLFYETDDADHHGGA